MEESTKTVSKPIRMDEKVTVRSLAQWTTGSKRLLSHGDITIPAKGMVQLTREEIIAQVQTGNRLFTGGALGSSHATWYIDDEWTRKETGLETDGMKQEFLTKDTVKQIFSIKTKKAFEAAIQDAVKTDSEKCALMSYIKDLKINDFDRITFCEHYTGVKY